MSPELSVSLIQEMLLLVLQLALPFLFLALVTGIFFGAVQHLTKIQEISFTFIPKLLVVFWGFALLTPWIYKLLTRFFYHLVVNQWDEIIRNSHEYFL